MKNFTKTVILACFPFLALTAQNNLDPHIGPGSQPSDHEVICEIPVHNGGFDDVGYAEGETVPDFTLYTPMGDRYRLGEVLEDGKPVVLVNGNYTCWRFRDQIASINAVANYYADQVKFFIIYTVEAHPYEDISPYSGTIWTGDRNFEDDILYNQPTTYGERLAVISDMRGEFGIVPEILVDGSCNHWWSNFGPAPNNAYIIDPTGVVVKQHAWTNAPPNDLWCDLGEYFEEPNEHCNDAGLNGDFSISFLQQGQNTTYGIPGETLTISTLIQNLSDTENVQIEIEREEVYAQEDWLTALCIDVCYSPGVSSATVTIPPGGSQEFIFYFYTGMNAGTGTASVSFQNVINPENSEHIEFTAITMGTTGIDASKASEWSVFPNPTADFVFLKTGDDSFGSMYSVFSVDGRIMETDQITSSQQQLDLSGFPAGIYFVQIDNSPGETRRIVKR